MWFDSHCHLDFPVFDADRDAVIARARQAGVERIFVPGVRPSQWQELPTLAQRYPETVVGVGLHPYFLHAMSPAERADALVRLPAEARRIGACAIGECGLDGRVAKRGGLGLDEQAEVLESHVATAAALDLPLVLHVVGAHGRALSLLQSRGFNGRGVLHSYTGPAELVPRYAELGFHFGFAAAITRPNAKKPQAALRAVPMDRLLLETDAPDQVPTGFRATTDGRNEPSGLIVVARAVARLREIDVPELAALTTDNARRLYGLE